MGLPRIAEASPSDFAASLVDRRVQQLCPSIAIKTGKQSFLPTFESHDILAAFDRLPTIRLNLAQTMSDSTTRGSNSS